MLFNLHITAIFFCYAIYKEMPGGSDETVRVTDKGVLAEGSAGRITERFMGRKKKYTETTFKTKVNAYFDSISFSRQVQILHDTGRKNAKGYPVMEYVGAVNDKKKPIYERVYTQAPSMRSLCLYLGISKQTLSNYEGESGAFAEIISWARLRVEEYLQLQLNAGIKRPQGLIFDLQCNHGWRTDKEPESARATIFIEGAGESTEYSE